MGSFRRIGLLGVLVALAFFAGSARADSPPAGTDDDPTTAAFGSLDAEADGNEVTVWTLCWPAVDAQLVSGRVTWGDKSSDDVGNGAADVTHSYVYGGTYAVKLTCRDTKGNAFTDTASVWVAGPAAPTTGRTQGELGRAVLLGSRRQTSGCKLGPIPDRRCSPGAYWSGLSQAAVCAASFRGSSLPAVSPALKVAVEHAYDVGRRAHAVLRLDHVVPLELGGASDVANLFPQSAAGSAGYAVKNKLEKKLRELVCAGDMSLRAAQRGIAANWEALYEKVFGPAAASRLRR